MKAIVVLFGLLAVGLAAEDTSKEREGRQFMIQPSHYSDDLAKNPLLPYMLPANYNPLFRQLPSRFLFGGSTATSSSASTTTTTVTTTINAAITCTLSTTACASGRRRRHVLADLLDKPHENIEASPVIPIEATVAPIGEANRDRREADPQYYLNPQYVPVPSFEQLSTNPLLKQTPIPAVNQVLEMLNNIIKQTGIPLVANNSPIDMFIAIMNGQIPNIWLPGQSTSSASRVTVTKTSCVIAVTTATSTPSCSAPGTLFQCPASTAASG